MAKSTKYWHERIEGMLRSTFYHPSEYHYQTTFEGTYFPPKPRDRPAITDDTLEREMDRKRIPDKHRAHFIERYRQVQREAIAARVAARLQGAERISVYGDNSAVRVFGPPHQGKTRLLRTFLETTGDGKVVGRLLSEDGSPIADGADLPPGHYRFEVVLDEVQDNV